MDKLADRFIRAPLVLHPANLVDELHVSGVSKVIFGEQVRVWYASKIKV